MEEKDRRKGFTLRIVYSDQNEVLKEMLVYYGGVGGSGVSDDQFLNRCKANVPDRRNLMSFPCLREKRGPEWGRGKRNKSLPKKEKRGSERRKRRISAILKEEHVIDVGVSYEKRQSR